MIEANQSGFKPQKKQGMSTFRNNLAGLSINKPQAAPSIPPAISPVATKAAPVEVKEIIPPQEEPVVTVTETKETSVPDETTTTVVETKEIKPSSPTSDKKPKATTKKESTARRNPNKIKSEKSNSTGRQNTKGINFAIGTECEEKFVACHRKQRMSRNSYFIEILEKEKMAYEANKDAYVEKNLDKLMEEKKVPARNEKKTVIKVDQELFDFVEDIAYDFYCNKDKFIRFAIRKEYERMKKNI